MPDKKLTDSEIVKALECCIKEEYHCNDCPYESDKHFNKKTITFDTMPNGMSYDQLSCDEWLKKDALDLINRLQAENERLNKLAELGNMRANDYRVMRDRALKAEKEVERLKEKREKCFYCTEQANKKIGEIKSEAYKEFWKELYVEMRMYGQQEKFTKSVFLSVADKVLKELVGEDDA